MNDDQLILKWLIAARACIQQHDDGGQTVLHIPSADVAQICLAALRGLPMDNSIRTVINFPVYAVDSAPIQYTGPIPPDVINEK